MKGKNLSRRSFVQTGSVALVSAAMGVSSSKLTAATTGGGEVLYNGIRLPDVWPPRIEKLTREPMPVPYLDNPPDVIPIDIGRQLFFDNFLIEKTTLERKFHQATIHPGSPLLKPDPEKYPWEKTKEMATAIPFSDGVWWDPKVKKYRLWYMSGFLPSATAYAESRDGIEWIRPKLDVKPGTNIVKDINRDSTTVWIDHNERDPKKRFKMSSVPIDDNRNWVMKFFFSPDGIHWTDEVASSGKVGDRSTFFYNPFRKKWVFSVRSNAEGIGRSRSYWEDSDFLRGAQFKTEQPTLWVTADRLDHPDPLEPDVTSQLYTLDANAYESVLLGGFSVMRGKKRKGNTVVLGFSRDGFHWDRPDRKDFIGTNTTPGTWNHDYLHLAGGCCLIVGDELRFYVVGRSNNLGENDAMRSMGMATLRRDGFASMEAGSGGGTLTTRPVSFKGDRLFVNAAAKSGELRAEVLDEKGEVIQPFTAEACIPVKGDKTLAEVRWKGGKTLKSVAGKPVSFRFTLQNAALYSFWVTPDKSGASNGYVAAGGPGFKGPIDTVGSKG